ncbi:MAG: DNA/RNA helicase domain-containing protein [Candidatus Omnitrophota bacterium]
MRLYSGTSEQFIQDSIHNQIAEKLKNVFFGYYRYYPSPAEINSWRNSLRSISQVFQHAELMDHGVILEYQLPLTSRRLDCMICGRDQQKTDNAIIVELKQWDKCEEAYGSNEVLTWVGGAKREVLHPSVQVGQYQVYLEDTHTAFNADNNPVVLNACTYLHNYNYYFDDVIFADKFQASLQRYPLFTADNVDNLTDYLRNRLLAGNGLDVLQRIEESKYRPNKKLMDHVGNIIKNKSEYILLDEQLIVYDSVLFSAKGGFHDKQKTIIVVKGGPGTGKSVIAINLMADLLLKGYNSHYATGSKAFTETLRKIIGTRGSAQLKYFNGYGEAEENAIDVLIADEAHRIRETSNSRFTPSSRRSNKAQIEELLRASKVTVFFIDDDQVVRPNEIGSVEYIKKIAADNKIKLYEYELEAQFRCNGSDAFVSWINNTLGIKRTAHIIWDQHEEFDFKIFSSPLELENAIREKASEGFTGRVTAGFCWDWSMPNDDGTLKDDVVIGDYKRPWDAKPEAKRLAPGIPKASLWAFDPNGINQVGCVYTAQGFEFDYVGVIFGEDLVYDFDKQEWIGNSQRSSDSVVKRSKEKFADLVKNTYRVLLSRGMKGCYVYFMNKDTERFFKSRIEGDNLRIDEPLTVSKLPKGETEFIERILQDIELSQKYKEYLPVYSLAAAAGAFGEGMDVREMGWVRVDLGKPLNKKLFVAKVVGKSMEPLIPDGSYCVFSANVVGSRANKIVLVQHNSISDLDTGGKYTVKKYTSKKKYAPDETWEHDEIILLPLNPAYAPIVIPNSNDGEFMVIAEFITILRQ